MSIKELFKYNSLFYIFILLQLLVIIFGIMDDEIIGNSIDVTFAVIIHFLCLLSFTLGYLPISKKGFINYRLIKKREIILSNKFVLFSVICIFIGLITSISTIGELMSPSEYLTKVFSGNSSQELIELKIESGEKGLSGIFKMLNYLPLGVYLVVNGIKIFYTYSAKDNSKLNKVIWYSLFACFIKMFFSLDRLTLLAILLVFFYRYFLEKKITLSAIFLIIFSIFILGFITSLRMEDSSILEFIIIYFKLSITNFQLVLDNQDEWSYGFNTFLGPLVYILKFFGYDNLMIAGPKKYIWNHAQYFASSFFIDFGYFLFIGFFVLGKIIRKIQLKAIYGIKSFPQFYFIVLFAIASFISVPIVRGIEFWIMLIIANIYNKFFRFV